MFRWQLSKASLHHKHIIVMSFFLYLIPCLLNYYCRPPSQRSMIMVLTQENSIKIVPLKQCIPLQAIETTLCIKQTSRVCGTWGSAPRGLGDSSWLRPMCSPDGTTHCLSQIVYTPEILHKFKWSPPTPPRNPLPLNYTKWWSWRLCICNSCQVFKRMPMLCA